MMCQQLSAVNLTLKVAGVSIDFLFLQLIGLTVKLWLSIGWTFFVYNIWTTSSITLLALVVPPTGMGTNNFALHLRRKKAWSTFRDQR
jgi:ABC-type molybdate transport system permease subunit